MNDEIQKENRPSLDRKTFLAEIERLYVEGYPTREIAQLLGEDGNKVGRNLRELKRRWARGAQRQRAALSQTQCAAVYREAMSGWGRSQLPKITTTEHRDADGKPVKTTVRRQEGPGDKTFLQAAVSALKTLRQFAQPQAGSPTDKDRDAGDPVYLAILQTLTPEQVDNLTHEQLQKKWLAQQYAIARHNLLLTQGLQLTPSGAPSAVNLTESASDARRIAWTEAMPR